MDLVLATNNPHKVLEIRKLLPESFRLLSLSEAGIFIELPEESDSFAGNALQKARTAFLLSGITSLADDSGLMVEALDGMPGVQSAYYAGPQKNDQKNLEKLLQNMIGLQTRNAKFITVFALAGPDGEFCFEGITEGVIIETLRGEKGFGYDPVFVPDGKSKTYAEMDPDEKNAISHRGKAAQKLKYFLESSGYS